MSTVYSANKVVKTTRVRDLKASKKRFDKTVEARTVVPTPMYGDKSNPLLFANFIDAALVGVGDACFEYLRQGTPLARKSCALRGAIAEAVVKRFCATELEFQVSEAEAGERVNGTKCGKNGQRYDFGMIDSDGTPHRVEVKNARMTYIPSMQMWSLHFCAVKVSEHEQLVLVFEGFDGLRLYRWCGANASTQGVRTEATGGVVVIHASRSQPDPVAAHAQLVAKMAERNELLRFIAYGESAYANLWETSTETDSIYKSVPMGAISHTARGAMLENVARSIMARDHAVADAPTGNGANGTVRGRQTTTCDFLADGDKVEVKSALMQWNTNLKCFKLQFQKIKLALHDRLLLVWMTPRGIHVFEHDRTSGISTNGESTDATGSQIQLCAPRGKAGYKVNEYEAAEQFLLKQFEWWGGKNRYVAFVAFSEGDVDRVLERGMVV